MSKVKGSGGLRRQGGVLPHEGYPFGGSHNKEEHMLGSIRSL